MREESRRFRCLSWSDGIGLLGLRHSADGSLRARQAPPERAEERFQYENPANGLEAHPVPRPWDWKRFLWDWK